MPVTLDTVRSQTIDAVFADFVSGLQYWPGKVMLDYSLFLHQAWRPLLAMLPLTSGMSILDVGTGYGIVAAELAANLDLAVHGVDIDPHYVEGARQVAARLVSEGVLRPGSTVTFDESDISALSCADNSFDFVLVREVYQFVEDPVKASAELFRVTKPGGLVCVSDNDDDIYVTYPDLPDSFNRLHRAIAAVQVEKGGDRRVGRKLSTYLSGAGYEINSVVAIPEARHWNVTEDDTERTFMIEQIREAKERVVDSGQLAPDEFDSLVADYEAKSLGERFRFNARIVVVGAKPAAA